MYDQLPIRPVFRDGHGSFHSTWLQAVAATGTVTIREPDPYFCYLSWRSRIHHAIRTTIAAEVIAVTETPPVEIRQMMWRRSGMIRCSIEKLAALGIEALSKYVSATLEPTKKYIASFSAGYDTRILMCLANVPDLTLVTWAPEVAASTDVYERLGLTYPRFTYPSRTDYWLPILRDTAHLAEYLGDPGRRTGGAGWLRRAGAAIGAHRLYSALWADETLGWAKHDYTLGQFSCARMLECPSPWPGLHPFISAPWLELLTTYSLDGLETEGLFSTADTLKREMIRQLQPDLLGIPNPRFYNAKRIRAGKELSYHVLSKAARDELQALHFRHERPPRYLGDGYGPWIRSYQFGVMLEAARKVAEVHYEESVPRRVV